jgi:hypothetical protein
MKKVGFIIFAAALVTGLIVSNIFSFGRIGSRVFNFSMDFGGVHGSGNVASEKRDLSGFKSIETGGVFQLEVTAQKDFSVEVEADDNLLPLIRTEVRDGVLRIETEKRLKSSGPIRIRVSAPDIERLDISGAASATLSNIKNSALAIDSSGASKINVSGETSKLSVDVSGATKINADELKAENAVIDSSGASYISVNVSGDLTSDVSGASKVVYSGSPKNVITKKSGVSSVTAK